MSVAERDCDAWDAIQQATRTCATCARFEDILSLPFLAGFPELPRPGTRPVLFVSEAPPRAGGVWKSGGFGREDDLREKLLPLLGLGSDGTDSGLSGFVSAGFYLFQSFPRPLKFSAAGLRRADLEEMLGHPVQAHLGPQIRHVAPRAIVTLGRVAAAALALIYPSSDIAGAFRAGDFRAVRGRTFPPVAAPPIGATYLPSGAGRFFRDRWRNDIPAFLRIFSDDRSGI
jgi:hypothetical protein